MFNPQDTQSHIFRGLICFIKNNPLHIFQQHSVILISTTNINCSQEIYILHYNVCYIITDTTKNHK